ncbi:MAG: hypothetical protein P8I03_08390 [Thalassotalea sp.]|nr:hypothetical protein [Thalassotalea sp.]
MRFPYFIGLIFILNSFSVLATKKACQPYFDKLRNIQSQQRAGYSNKKGRSLAEREQKARDKWWQCQQGKLPNKKRKKAKQKSKVNSSLSQTPFYKIPTKDTLSFSNKLTIKAKFKGVKQQAWLDYYQQPKKCKMPKSTKVFAYCLEDEQEQQEVFDRQYQN